MTREEKLKTIRIANRIIFNKLQGMGSDLQEFSANVDYLSKVFKAPIPKTNFVEEELRKMRPQPRQPLTPAIPETPEDRAKFEALLSELKEQK